MGIITLNEDDSNLRSLTKVRPIGSIPIFGRYRIIDFMLSSMVNSAITNVVVFTLGSSRSLRDHLGTGKPWDLNRKIDGLYIFSHANDKTPITEINLLKSNQESLVRSRKSNVILAPSYMLCNIDLTQAALFHEKSGCDVTIVYKKANGNQKMFLDSGILNFRDDGVRVSSIGRNTGTDANVCISTEIFLMSKQFCLDCLGKALQHGGFTTIKDYVYANVNNLKVAGFEFKGYLGCINSVSSYYKVSMDVMTEGVMTELFMDRSKIYTKSNDSPPTKYLANADVSNSLIANGCIIDGKVKNSILSRGVIVEKGAQVIDSVLFARTIVKRDVTVKNAILDKAVVIEQGKVLVGDPVYPIVIEKGSKLV